MSERTDASIAGAGAPVPRDIERLARVLDDRFQVPLLGWRVGLDGLVGLLPGAGDIATAAVAVYIVYRARRLGVPFRTRLRMVANVALDLVIGTLPVAGDIFDFAWKANRRNVQLIRRHLEQTARASDPHAEPRSR